MSLLNLASECDDVYSCCSWALAGLPHGWREGESRNAYKVSEQIEDAILVQQRLPDTSACTLRSTGICRQLPQIELDGLATVCVSGCRPDKGSRRKAAPELNPRPSDFVPGSTRQ